MKTTLKNRYHRDGTVTFWNVYTQTWERCAARCIYPQILATMTAAERARIAKIVAR